MLSACHCGLAPSYTECCEKYHLGQAMAPTAEALMRSRYSAFVVIDFNYLVRTHDPKTRSEFNLEVNRKWAQSVRFTKLEILRVEEKLQSAVVEFRAHFTELATGHRQVHHEVSDFRREGPDWFFMRGR